MIVDLPLAPTEPATVTAGSGLLEFQFSGNRTVVSQAQAISPLKFLNPRNHGKAAWVYTSSYGGGLVGGDCIRLKIDVAPEAAALLATQASTKVYRSEKSTSQEARASVADNALLVLAPDPIVCFAGSRYSQRQDFKLAKNANLVVVDWLTGGRWASGERWDFERYQSRIRIWREERQILHESLLLDPFDGALPRRLSRFNTLLVAAITGPALNSAATELLAKVGALPLQRNSELIISASPLKDSGVLLRIAGVSVEEVARTLRQNLQFLCPILGDDPWARKW